jgi:hypothetical protein
MHPAPPTDPVRGEEGEVPEVGTRVDNGHPGSYRAGEVPGHRSLVPALPGADVGDVLTPRATDAERLDLWRNRR